jgi:hypothetical protein
MAAKKVVAAPTNSLRVANTGASLKKRTFPDATGLKRGAVGKVFFLLILISLLYLSSLFLNRRRVERIYTADMENSA